MADLVHRCPVCNQRYARPRTCRGSFPVRHAPTGTVSDYS